MDLFDLCLYLSPHSPTKSEFIRAKYQMLAFVHKLPCRDDDGVTTKDLSKVRPLQGVSTLDSLSQSLPSRTHSIFPPRPLSAPHCLCPWQEGP